MIGSRRRVHTLGRLEAAGGESPSWYGPPGETPEPGPLSWQRERWFPHWENEHRAARERVIVMDMSFMGKFLVQGRDAGRSLNLISAGDVDGPVGKITYTQWLNEHGLLEADLTVSKLSDDAYLVVVTDTMVRHAYTWMKRHFPPDAHATITDVTSGYAQLNVQGTTLPGTAAIHHERGSFQRSIPVPHGARDRHWVRALGLRE